MYHIYFYCFTFISVTILLLWDPGISDGILHPCSLHPPWHYMNSEYPFTQIKHQTCYIFAEANYPENGVLDMTDWKLEPVFWSSIEHDVLRSHMSACFIPEFSDQIQSAANQSEFFIYPNVHLCHDILMLNYQGPTQLYLFQALFYCTNTILSSHLAMETAQTVSSEGKFQRDQLLLWTPCQWMFATINKDTLTPNMSCAQWSFWCTMIARCARFGFLSNNVEAVVHCKLCSTYNGSHWCSLFALTNTHTRHRYD